MTLTAPQQIDPLLALLRQQSQPVALPTFAVGDQVRVLADSRMGPKAPRIGDLGTVVAIRPKAEAMAVYGNCVERVYLLDFGPDENCCGGRDTWGFADGDIGPADTPAPKKRKRRKKG